MKDKLLNAYMEQLPKYKKLDWLNIFLIFITISSFIIALIQFHYSPKNAPEYIYSIFLVSLVIFLIIYTYIREGRRYHRYSESILHIYYAQERVKEYLTLLSEENFDSQSNLKKISEDIVNVLSNCFSLLTSKNCSISIKTINSDGKISTFVRDNKSETRYHQSLGQEKHNIDENTDFEFIKNNHKRYFISNNLKQMWEMQKYKNSSFKIVGKPEIKKYCCGIKRTIKWNLPYKSTLVVPIRYISSENIYYYYGFLCIDANCVNIFNKKIDPELAMIFADIICTLMSQEIQISKNIKLQYQLNEMEKMIDDYTKPSKKRK